MASMCRSAALAAMRSSALRSQILLPKASPSRLASPLFSRSIASALGIVESLMPLHNAVAAARLISNIAVDSSCWSWPSQVYGWHTESEGEEAMDELRRRRSFWFDRSQSGSERAAEAEPQRRSFIRNGSQSFLRRFICGSDGLAWQLQPISPEYVPQPRYRLLSWSATETPLSYEPRTPPESHQGNRRGDLKAVEVVRALEMKTAVVGSNCCRSGDNVEGDDNKAAELQWATSSVREGKKWRSWLPDAQRRWPVQGW